MDLIRILILVFPKDKAGSRGISETTQSVNSGDSGNLPVKYSTHYQFQRLKISARRKNGQYALSKGVYFETPFVKSYCIFNGAQSARYQETVQILCTI